MKILTLNSGSSNCKLALYDCHKSVLANPQNPLWQTTVNWNKLNSSQQKSSLIKALASMPIPFSEVEAAGHRIVHGGHDFVEPTVLSLTSIKKLKKLIPLAPLHLPQNIEGIEIIKKLNPDIPQIGVFDTSFHATLEDYASTYAGPYEWVKLGIKRYGFHGISYEYCSAKCSALLKQPSLKIVCCHLGNGASLAAIDRKRSVDTTMGFTPLEGLMMGTRCGSIDPGITLYLQQNHKQTYPQLFEILNHSSGLKGISGKSSDMREILKLKAKKDPRALLSYKMYIHSLKRNMGSMFAVLEGVDVLIFTGGIGENSPQVRLDACKGLNHFGIELDKRKNQSCKGDEIISTPKSTVKVLVIKTQEDWCIAQTIEKMRFHGTV